jgi:signal transduction histidine kinase
MLVDDQINKKEIFDEITVDLLNIVPNILLILDSDRKIVFANNKLFNILDSSDVREILGLRPGEAFDCIHLDSPEKECGTTEFCRYCGANNAINTAIAGTRSLQECRILRKDNTALDLQVEAFPRIFNGINYTVFILSDISAQKRQEHLEKIFLHDIMNTASGIYNLTKTFKKEIFENNDELGGLLISSTERLIDEIRAQRQIAAAEKGVLPIDKIYLRTGEILDSVLKFSRFYAELPDSELKIEIDENSADLVVRTDKTILQRVLLNLIKNAIESEQPEGKVKIGSKQDGKYCRFYVRNQNVMPENVSKQIFKRYFSTKGSGRGLGTYSVKLLTENYLGGQVRFKSQKGFGTEFSILIEIED